MYNPKICPICKIEFIPNSGIQKYCSNNCKKTNGKKYIKEYNSKRKKYMKEYLKKYREIHKIEINKSRYSKNNHCIGIESNSCNKLISNDAIICRSCSCKQRYKLPENNPMYGIKGKDSPGYIHGRGYEPYNVKFTEELKDQIRKRDNYECQNCGMTEEEHLIVIGQVLHIHHIDYNKENCEENNLITTCKSCNLRANANRDYWKSFYNNKIKEVISA
jgi:5-methylcytosine-specific restriction endonuclease McrA